MTTKKTSAGAPAEAPEAPTSVTAALAALETASATFLKDQQDLIKLARAEATKAGEEFAKLAQRPDPKVLEELQLDLSTARLQLTEVSTEMAAAAQEVRTAHATADGLRAELAEAQTTISALREAARADAEPISSMRSRTEAIAAQFEAARNVLSLPDLDFPTAAEAAAEPAPAQAEEPVATAPAPFPEPAADLFGLDDAPAIEAEAKPEPAPFPEPAAEAKTDDGLFTAAVLRLVPSRSGPADADFDARLGCRRRPDFETPRQEPGLELELRPWRRPQRPRPGDGPADLDAREAQETPNCPA
jgi:hypothetical protein